MKICKVNNYTAPAKHAQGAQMVLEALSYQFQKDGHEVSLLLNKGSKCDFGRLVNKIPEDVDIVHYHGGLPHEYGHNHKLPWVTTSHGGGIDTQERMAEVKKYTDHIIFVSKFCADLYESDCFIYNCLNEQDFVFSDKKDDYFLWIAGTDWGEQKGLFSSIMFAKKLGFKLKIAGGGKNQQIIEEIKRNCGPKIEYLGFVNGREKAELLSKAKALLMIGDILDACPLNNIEALASGTPIIAKNRGSHPEVVNNKVGFVCESSADIVKAIMRIGKINPLDCRKHFENTFSTKIIAKRYITIYESMIKSGTVRQNVD